MIKFGPAGNSNSFYDKGFKLSEQMPKYVYDMGLDLYEYQCSRGVRVSEEKAEKLKEQAEKYHIELSVHAPYYISLSTQEEDKKTATINYITDTMQVALKMGAKRIVVHSGSLLGLDREYAVSSACELLKRAIAQADNMGLGDVHICPETMGKLNQLGDSKEVIQLCRVDERCIPTIDFGHLYCRSLGRLATYDQWLAEMKLYLEELGYERMKNFHSHFSKMEYTKNGGEKRHVTFSDEGFGPDFTVIAKVLKELKLEPNIICESAGTQCEDSQIMKQIWKELKEE